ncbi:aminoglycoside phosphotransferase family protein [Planococcus sp. 107-1]|uniref:aminoglycoside phosphotransferase family protein n=1 Tax=Planococcus sp. 107-1 TaxID=2908840 RepID=UPI001F404D61|nr:aminoglycoside phosphotransferase family protein [Planococcus sp. 107-1]UJF27939.1 aminoglycoside phosphotransferase family protein [Planococcus sp. 107-1]
MNQVKSILKDFYDIEINDVLPQQGGWASLAYKVFNKNQSYFLKVYEKGRASTPKLTALIDQYVPILVWLINNSNLNGKITVPLITSSGEYKCEDENAIYLLYEYIEGETIGDQDLTDDQVRQLSKMITEIHSFGKDIPVETAAIKEDFEVPFLQMLRQLLQKGREDLPSDVWELVQSYMPQLNDLIQAVEELSLNLKNVNLSMALCHTDLHYWNMIQSEQQLILIDWEGLKLAPVEADLMFLVDKPYFNEFLSIYQKTHQNFSINPEAMTFYEGKRRLEDIWEFLEQLLYDKQEEQERFVIMNYLQEELHGLSENLY